MKFKTPLLVSGAGVLLLCGMALTSCDKEDGPDYPKDTTFRQVLRVEQWSDGETNAFADFLVQNTQTNKVISVELPKGASVTANGLKLKYNTPNPEDPGSYAYGATLGGTPSEVTFVFTRMPGVTLTNKIVLSSVPMIRVAPGDIRNGVAYNYTSSLPEATNAAISIVLIGKSGEQANKRYTAELFNNTFTFNNVPAGNYVLRTISTQHIDFLSEPNGLSGGERYASKVFQLTSVKVE